jgi:hypothetical protein
MARYSTSYRAEVDLLVEVMEQKPEGVVLSNQEIAGVIGIKPDQSTFRSIVTQAIGKPAEKKVPVSKLRGVGIYRVTPEDHVRRANELLGQGQRRIAKKTFKALSAVELASLEANEQTVYIAANMKAQMAVNLASDANHLVLCDEIKSAGNKPIDMSATCLKLLQHNR